jgi:poly(3-hydroxybutyrate) depolymerase
MDARTPARRWILAVALLTGSLLAAPPDLQADEPAYPAGRSKQEIEGLRTWLRIPERISADAPASLVVILHGAGGSGSGMVDSLAAWERDGYVVCAPKAKDMTWEPNEVEQVKAIALHLIEVLPIDPRRVHVVGYSNGGWNLNPLAFDDDLQPCSATWIAAGCRGAKVPRWAAKGLGVIALAGSDDPNVGAARQTVSLLQGKVRNVEVRTQMGLEHAWPSELMGYLQWWMGVQEGRFTPGDDQSFDWGDDLTAAVAALEGARKGGVLVYFFSAEDAESEEAKTLQHATFFDPDVRFLGRQLQCVKLDIAEHGETAEALGVTATPAVVVLDRKGAGFASALRSVAPQKRPPRD